MRGVLLATAAATVGARKFQFTLDGSDPNPFLGKFAFGYDAGGGTVGSVTLSYSGTDAEGDLSLLEFYDDIWDDVYPSQSCADAASTLANKCDSSSSQCIWPLTPSGSGSISNPFQETQRPHYWYFTLANNPTSSQGACSPGVSGTFTLEATQAGGSELSYDELGLPALYGVFWAAYAIMLAAHVWRHYFVQPRFAPALVVTFTVSLAMQMSSCFCHMIDWSNVSRTGYNILFFGVLGGLLRIGSSVALLVLCALHANGYGISTFTLTEKGGNKRGLYLLGAVVLTYLVLIIVAAADRDPKRVVDYGTVVPSMLALIFILLFAGWWLRKVRQTYEGEVNTTKKALLLRLALALGGNFLILPCAEFLGAVVPPYERLRVVVGFDVFFMTLLYAATTYVLWPSRAADAFRVYDGSVAAAMLGAVDGSNTDFHAALDEAYSYTAMANEAPSAVFVAAAAPPTVLASYGPGASGGSSEPSYTL